MVLDAVKTMRFSVKIISLSGISDIKMVKKAVILAQIFLRKAVNHIQIFARKTVSDSFDFTFKDITRPHFSLEIEPFSKIFS